jgi:uncharacterized protein YcaQ
VATDVAVTTVPAADTRRLLLEGAGLLSDPTRRATTATVHRAIEQIGFVQVDTINVVERAHHQILMSRFDGYRPDMLKRLLERDRKLFEHWTHDASVLPAAWLPYWRSRFRRFSRNWKQHKWWETKMGDVPRVTRFVRQRIAREGALSSRDFETPPDQRGNWWGWSPVKAALEFLWRRGDLAVTARDGFTKVYDLMERVHPDDGERVSRPEYVEWACSGALERLVVATSSELAGYWGSVTPEEAKSWCAKALKSGRVEAVQVGSGNGSPTRPAVAAVDWRERARRSPEAPSRMRLLSPFDPLIRDRKRLERLFGFRYRFEAYVPAPKRVHGYYVMPVLEGERLVARLDSKHHRDDGDLEVRGVWWEDGEKVTAARRRRLDEAVERFALQIGAERVR